MHTRLHTLLRAGVVAAAAAALVVAAGCNDGPRFKDVRDVRPNAVEIGEKMVVELDVESPTVQPLVAGAPTRVRLRGAIERTGGKIVALGKEGLILPNARATGPSRVVVDADGYVASIVGRGTFTGTVTVEQKRTDAGAFEPMNDREPPRGAAASEPARYTLRFFPRTVRKFAYDLVGGREENTFLDWLGLEVEPVPAPQGDGTALSVVAVRRGFPGLSFVFEHDCGVWDQGAKDCAGALDSKVSWGEAQKMGYTDQATFDRVDTDGDGSIDRHEATDAESDPSPAAVAGVADGDVIVSADGKRTPSVGALAAVWDGKGATVDVAVARKGAEVHLSMPRYGKPATIPSGFLLAGILFIVGLLVVGPIPVIGGFIVVWERKISGLMQSRPGPNRVGPRGWLQWLADGLKLIVKEDIIPTESDPLLFRLSPFVVFAGVFLTFVIWPWSPVLQIADLNIGVLYGLSVTSIVVVGIIMGGWASNSKWSLLGGMRSAAQIISYELPASIAILSVVAMAGTLSTQELVRNQGGAPWHWHLFDNPFTFGAFFIFFISALAEGNRTPFDLPEAESELVAGYNTEYSGFRFSIFALSEWVNLVVIGAVLTTVFLGGWNIPFVTAAEIESSGWLNLLAFVVFASKVVFIVFVCIWIRWTLPRFRIDHMMTMCWKYFMPLSLVAVVGVSAWAWLLPDVAREIARWIMFLVFGVGVGGFFLSRVAYTWRTTRVWRLRGA